MNILLICILFFSVLLAMIIPHTLNKPGIGTYKGIFQSCFLLGSFAFVLPLLAKENGWQGLGIFIGWEFGAIVQTIVTFMHFAKQDSIPFLSNRSKTHLNIIIMFILFLCLFLYSLTKILLVFNVEMLNKSTSIGAVGSFIVTDAITLIPLLLYFILNVFLYIYIKDKMRISDTPAKAYLELLWETIRFIDLPCIIPYTLIIIFAYFHKSDLDWSTFISGAGALLLLTSNLLTDTVGDKLKKKMEMSSVQ